MTAEKKFQSDLVPVALSPGLDISLQKLELEFASFEIGSLCPGVCLFATFAYVAVIKYSDKKQLRAGRVVLSHDSKAAAHHSREVETAGTYNS